MKTLKSLLLAAALLALPGIASAQITQNWDGVTAPAKPTGWVYNGAWLTESSVSKSAPNALSDTNQGSDDIAMYGTKDAFGGNVTASEDFYITGILQSRVYVRADATANPQNYYSGTVSAGNGGGSGIYIEKEVAGNRACISNGGNPAYVSSFATGQWYNMALTANGSSLSLQVLRYSDGMYLQPGGAWGAAKASVFTVSDTSLPAASGYVGISDYNANSSSYIDNFSAVQAGMAPLTSGTLTPGAVTPTSIALSWTAAAGGTAPYSYQVLRAPDASGAPGTFAADGPVLSALSLTDTGLTPGTKYWYEVAETDSEPTPVTVTTTPVFGTTVSLPQIVGAVTVAALPAGDVVTVPAAAAGTNAIASASLFIGTSQGAELATPALTVTSPAFPLSFTAQAPAAAGAAKFYIVRLADSAGNSSSASNEVSVKTSSLAAKGTTSSPQTFVAAYGPAFTGLPLGYTFFDSTGAVFARRSAAGVSELAGQGVYSVQPAVDTALLGSGYILWDAPSGTAAFAEPVAAAAGGSGTTVTYLTPALTHNTSLQPVLAWSADTTATGYKVMRSTDGINYTVIATLAPGILTYTDVARPIGGTCHYLVETTH